MKISVIFLLTIILNIPPPGFCQAPFPPDKIINKSVSIKSRRERWELDNSPIKELRVKTDPDPVKKPII